ncbi:sigma-70 family RNA polymerase sigma factor [Myceligenerans pegani]|uniref:Sigma-70 family RNA polymerase sigma factor n=1 Tax=Myceligenerans pegani TaxID=2776917 RepID=A0ABR9MUP6_9MICO|nr:sigma-70 family RNA polymerase sigma factor [Myceligenerans sp. TRM 65318]MBE1875103.1 sigma-70 family RNA polymerase sigma factor [Myceligenerans sp. TRM 65318]MBE3017374.1 sigma-70 family RNA polymerase sigma factor [Myceligenerans sp. TRM 65318]
MDDKVETEDRWLADRFEEDRPRLVAVAHRMLGSTAEAEDAVQEAWLRLAATESSEIQNLSGWLTTVVGRVCLDQLRSRKAKREQPIPEAAAELPAPPAPTDPEEAALLADSVGVALLVVLETLDPAERLAFVLHDMFGVPFDQIAGIVDRSPVAARQLASRARRRVRGTPEPPSREIAAQRHLAEAFTAAAREGDFEALVALLDPDITLRTHSDDVCLTIRGAANIAGRAIAFSSVAETGQLVRVGDRIGAIGATAAAPPSVMVFTVEDGRITALDAYTDPELIRGLGLALLDV